MEARDIEIVIDLLAPRAEETAFAKAPDGSGIVGLADADRLVIAARHEFEARQVAGDAVASAILMIGQPDWTDEGIAALAAAISGHRGSTDEPALQLYDCAVGGFRRGMTSQAAVLLATMLHLGAGQAEAMSGLALCAARLGKFEQALLLANESLRLPEKHPRAYCIAGFCELERGNRKAAQSLLAIGARVARGRSEFAEVLRAAQRVLLILHFA